MRNRSFQAALHSAIGGRLGLFAPAGLVAILAASTMSYAAGPATVGDTGAPQVPQASSTPGEAPAFAGRVDPGTYRVGPGDEFAFRSSDLLDPRILRVGPTGEILLPDAGSIAAAGLTLRELDARAREALRPFIRGKGFVLTLHRPRRFRAVVVGDVERPGTVLVQAPVRASDVIEAAGGVTAPGARRGLFIIRGADTLWVDLVRFERTGDLDTNPLVFETDVIVVPPSNRHVEVLGAVGHPGRYDLAPGDRASTLLTVSGGLQERAAVNRLTLSRQSAPGRRTEISIAPIGPTGDVGDVASATTDPALEPGDLILVPERAHWRAGAHVEIRGEVPLPGPYAIDNGVDRLGDILGRAGGFTEWADSNAVRIERRSDAAIRDSAFVRLARDQAGLISEGERGYLVALVRENAAVSASALGRSGSWGDISLVDGDRVVVPRQTRSVMVQGEVRAPGHVPFGEGRRLDDYVDAAGGFTGRANKSRVRVTLAATGRTVSTRDVRELHAGDAIWVPAREPRSFWGTARDVLTTAAQAATIYLVVREATR